MVGSVGGGVFIGHYSLPTQLKVSEEIGKCMYLHVKFCHKKFGMNSGLRLKLQY